MLGSNNGQNKQVGLILIVAKNIMDSKLKLKNKDPADEHWGSSGMDAATTREKGDFVYLDKNGNPRVTTTKLVVLSW